MKNILITGGGGYIARSIYKNLHTKYNITTITRQDFDLLSPEATNQYFKDKYFDVVIHTAVVGGTRLKSEDQTIIQHNLHMYWNILANKSQYGKLISFGSGAELGMPTTPYGISKKVIADSMLEKDNFLNIRIFAVFDEYELDTRFIKTNIQNYIDHKPITIHGNKSMDFFYMPDLISLVDYFLQKDEWDVRQLDCTYKQSYSLLQIANLINNLSDYKVDVLVGNLREKPYIGNYKDLPCVTVGLEQGIKNVYNNLKQNK